MTHLLAICNDHCIVSLLLHNGAHINVQSKDGHSSLMLASLNGKREAVFLLIQNGACVNTER